MGTSKEIERRRVTRTERRAGPRGSLLVDDEPDDLCQERLPLRALLPGLPQRPS